VPELADLIAVGKLKDILPATHGGFDNFAYYETQFKLDGDLYTAVLNIGIKINGKTTQSTLYEIDKIQIKNSTPHSVISQIGGATPTNIMPQNENMSTDLAKKQELPQKKNDLQHSISESDPFNAELDTEQGTLRAEKSKVAFDCVDQPIKV
jgi:hypothetical protein